MRRFEWKRYAISMVVMLWVLAMAGCEQKTINQIKAEPQRYANHEVGIVGRVTRSASLAGVGAYEIDDGTGKMWVVSKTGVPREGARVGVKGKIRDGFNLGGLIKLPEVISSGMVLIESSHRAK